MNFNKIQFQLGMSIPEFLDPRRFVWNVTFRIRGRRRDRWAIVVAVVGLSAGPAYCGYIADAKTARLADCGLTMAYTANLALARNNPGQARLYIHQYSRAFTALFAQNYRDGIVSGEKMEAWKSRSSATKQYLDENHTALASIVDSCLKVIQQAVEEVLRTVETHPSLRHFYLDV